MLVTARDELNVGDIAHTFGSQRRNHVAETAAKVWHADVGTLEWRWARDHRRVVEVSLTEAARVAA